MVPGDGGVLRLYPGAPHYDGYINVVSFDMRNNAKVDNFQGSNSTFAYVPVIYARLAFIADAQVDHVTLKSKILGDMDMDHLAGSYLKTQALMVPILPGATALDLTINGFEISVLISDMRVEDGPGFIVKETNTYTGPTRGNTVYAGSAATSNAFAIATSNGTMTADVTVWLTGEAEMSLDTTYSVGVDTNRGRPSPYIFFGLRELQERYDVSLYYWGLSTSGYDQPVSVYNYWTARQGYPTLPEIRNDVRQSQWETNRDYKQNIDDRLDAMGNRGIGGNVMVYKNGEYVKTVSLVGSGLPVSRTSYTVTGLPEAYWPPGTISSREFDYDGRYQNRKASYNALSQITVHQEADIAYQSSTPQALVEVDVDTGDMVQFVIQARLGTSGISAPPMVGIQVDPRLHTNSTSVESTGYRDATVTIEGGSIDIFCCS